MNIFHILYVFVQANHGQALQSCRDDFGGQLVTPLNSQQINFVRQGLEQVGETRGEVQKNNMMQNAKN